MLLVRTDLAVLSLVLAQAAACTYTPPIAGEGEGGGGGSSSSGMMPAGKEIFCGNQTCTNNQVCCLDLDVANNSICTEGGGCQYVRVDCDGPEDCPTGQRCCGHAAQTMTPVTEIRCDETCDFPNRVLCNIMTGAGCESGEICKDAPGIDDKRYSVCGPF